MSKILLSLLHHIDTNWEQELELKKEERKKLQAISNDLTDIYNTILSELNSDTSAVER